MMGYRRRYRRLAAIADRWGAIGVSHGATKARSPPVLAKSFLSRLGGFVQGRSRGQTWKRAQNTSGPRLSCPVSLHACSPLPTQVRSASSAWLPTAWSAVPGPPPLRFPHCGMGSRNSVHCVSFLVDNGRQTQVSSRCLASLSSWCTEAFAVPTRQNDRKWAFRSPWRDEHIRR